MIASVRWLGHGFVVVSLALALAPGAQVGVPEADRERRGPRGPGDPDDRFDQPDAAQRFHARRRVPPGQSAIPVERYQAALAQMRRMRVFSSATNQFASRRGRWDVVSSITPMAPNLATWDYLGPSNVGGRTRAILFDPLFASNQTMYAGGVAGGVFKSTDAGSSWNPTGTATLTNLAVSTMAMSPSDSQTILVGTGEGYFNIDAVRGNGIFKTTDGGTTWAQIAATNNSNFYYVNRIVYSGANAGYVYAATGSGLWQSTDSGATWTRILNPGLTGGCMDVVVRNDQAGDEAVTSCGEFNQGKVFHNAAAKTTPSSWTEVLNSSNIGSGIARTSLAIAPNDQSYVYALSSRVQPNYALRSVYRSTDGGANFTAMHTYSGSGAASSAGDLLLSGTFTACGTDAPTSYTQGWYDQHIAVDPTNRDHLFTSGVQLFRSLDGGATWGSLDVAYGGGIHPDEHVIAFPPDYDGTSHKSAYAGNDGGVYRIDDTTATPTTSLSALCNQFDASNTFSFTELNSGYAVTQFYYGAVYPNNTTYFGGTQDNGTNRGSDGGGVNWSSIFGGDGGDVAVDPGNTNVLYVETTGNSIRKSTNGGSSFASAHSGISDGFFQFIAPFTMDPTNAANLWTGGNFIWRTTNAAGGWSQASTSLGSSVGVSALAVSPTNSNHVLVGADSARSSATVRRSAPPRPRPGPRRRRWVAVTSAPSPTTRRMRPRSTPRIPISASATCGGAPTAGRPGPT